MEFIDLKTQQERIRTNLEERLQKILDHGQYIFGPEVEELEAALSSYVGVKHCISCASGTDALLLTLLAEGIGSGDAVLVPSFTFVATAEVVALVGAVPIFVDIDRSNFNISPISVRQALDCLSSLQIKARALITVDLFGLPANYPELELIAKEHELVLIEDAAQSFGAHLKGKRCCGFGKYATTSFFPAKPLGCYGDGGAVFCIEDEAADILRSIRNHGQGATRYDHVRVGVNARMDTFQAAVLLEKLEIFDEELSMRQEVAARYQELSQCFRLQEIPDGFLSAYSQFALVSSNREKILAHLAEVNIPSAIYYPTPLHLQPAYKGSKSSIVDLSVSEELANEIFAIPMHPYLSSEQQIHVVSELVSVAYG